MQRLNRHAIVSSHEVPCPAGSFHVEPAGGFDACRPADALHLMAEAALRCAGRHAGCAVVMAKADGIEFARPVPAGSAVDIRAEIAFQGRSSMTVLVGIAPRGDGAPRTGPSISGRFMLVAVDGAGRPVPIPVSDQRTAEEVRP